MRAYDALAFLERALRWFGEQRVAVKPAMTESGAARASHAWRALRLVKEEEPHLVLLDLMLPDTDGIELMGSILDIADVPVIFVSVYGQDDYVVRAFDMGASNYIVKPFSPSELGARIRAALRKRRPADLPEPAEPYVLGDLARNFMERRVTLAGRPVELTATEYRLLVELAANPGRVVTNGQLLERIWGAGNSAGTAPMRNIVSRLRRKLGDSASDPRYIFNESSVGYRIAQPQGWLATTGGTRFEAAPSRSGGELHAPRPLTRSQLTTATRARLTACVQAGPKGLEGHSHHSTDFGMKLRSCEKGCAKFYLALSF